MLVKCWDLGEKREREQCYKAPNNKYYSSQEAYEEMVKNHEYRDKCIDLYREWVGRVDQSPSIWTKKMQEVKAYGPEVVYVAMLLADNGARYSVANKDFNNEYQMAAYLWAIVNGNILKASKQIKQKQQREKEAKIIEQADHQEDIEEPVYHRSSTVDLSKYL